MFSFVKYLISFCINLTNSSFVTYVNTFQTNVYFPDLLVFVMKTRLTLRSVPTRL